MSKTVRFMEKTDKKCYILDDFERDSKKVHWTIIKSQIPLIMMIQKIKRETNVS
jgi:hypothetical protein